MTQTPFNNGGAKKPGFWKRQFAPVPTEAQDRFDSIFAVVLPLLCLVADPIVFKGLTPALRNYALLADYQLLAYLVSTVEVGLFLTWRTFRLRLRPYATAFAGFFFAAAIFSGVIGLAILPYSLFALILVVGILGFIPFLTAFVFLRNGVRAMRIQVTASSLTHRFAVALLSAVLVIALPVFTNMTIETALDSTVESMIEGNATEAQLAALRLREFRFVPSKYTDRIATAYSHESDPVKRSTFNAVYQDITGEDLEIRQRMRYFD
jgi:hypothetical protein